MKHRSNKAEDERMLMKYILEGLGRGGKVLLPLNSLVVFEFCALLQSIWDKCGLNATIYIGSDLAATASDIFKRFPSWLNGAKQTNFSTSKMFQRWDNDFLNSKEPCVLLASPSILNRFSLPLFIF